MSDLITKDAVTLAYALLLYTEDKEELKDKLADELTYLEAVQLLDVEVLPYTHNYNGHKYTHYHALITVGHNNNNIAFCVNAHSRTFMYKVNDRKIRFMNHIGGRVKYPLRPNTKDTQEIAELAKRVLVTEW